MANLIDQMNILKGLGDEHLAAEVNAPSGSAPPYLVLAELNRRKVMREKYAGEQARRKPQTTVAQDVTTSMPPQNGGMGLDAAPPMTGMGGVGSPTGLEAGAAPMPSYAEGGIVAYADGGGINYDDISKRYADRLEGLGGDKDQARALALITAGATIMGGKSSNALTNIGAGIGPAVQQYSDALKTTDSEELALLRGMTDIGQLQQSAGTSAADLDLRRQQMAQDQSQFEQRLATDKTPAALVTLKYLKEHPEDTQLFTQIQAASGTDPSFGQDARAQAAFSGVFDDVHKQVQAEAASSSDPRSYSQDPAKQKAFKDEMDAKAYSDAVERFASLYPEWPQYIARYRAQAAKMAGGTTPTGVPTGAPASTAVPYTDYMN